MLTISKAHRYYIYRQPADMRNGFDGLSGIVSREFLRHPLSGDIFIFLNKPRNRIKLLHWEGDGYAIYCKRLERGTYEIPLMEPGVASYEISAQQLMLMLEGIALMSVKKRKRYALINN
jgi:transposase